MINKKVFGISVFLVLAVVVSCYSALALNNFADYDNDGKTDVVLQNLFKNTGTEFLIASNALGLNVSDVYIGFFIDYDKDNDYDIYFIVNNSENRVYENNAGSFSNITLGIEGNSSCNNAAAEADFDNNGYTDLFVCNKLFLNFNGTFNESTTRANLHNLNFSYAEAFDFNNDSMTDILGVSDSGKIYLMLNYGDSNSDNVPEFFSADSSLISTFANDANSALANYLFNFSFKHDVGVYILRNISNILVHSDESIFGDIPLFKKVLNSGAEDNGNSVAGIFDDFDNNTITDLFVFNNGGSNRLYLRNGTRNPLTFVEDSSIGNISTGDYFYANSYDLFNSGENDVVLRGSENIFDEFLISSGTYVIIPCADCIEADYADVASGNKNFNLANIGTAECYDGIDNDGDSKIDYPNDPDCSNTTDNNESNESPPPSVSTGGGGRRRPKGNHTCKGPASIKDNNLEIKDTCEEKWSKDGITKSIEDKCSDSKVNIVYCDDGKCNSKEILCTCEKGFSSSCEDGACKCASIENVTKEEKPPVEEVPKKIETISVAEVDSPFGVAGPHTYLPGEEPTPIVPEEFDHSQVFLRLGKEIGPEAGEVYEGEKEKPEIGRLYITELKMDNPKYYSDEDYNIGYDNFIEIYNSGKPVVLRDYYLTTIKNYWNIVLGNSEEFDLENGDMLVKFPDKAIINSKQYITVAYNREAYESVYGEEPTYDLSEMVPVYLDERPFLNEDYGILVLFKWDGSEDLVEDADIVTWMNKGAKHNSLLELNPKLFNKEGISIDSVYDDDSEPSVYKEETSTGGTPQETTGFEDLIGLVLGGEEGNSSTILGTKTEGSSNVGYDFLGLTGAVVKEPSSTEIVTSPYYTNLVLDDYASPDETVYAKFLNADRDHEYKFFDGKTLVKVIDEPYWYYKIGENKYVFVRINDGSIESFEDISKPVIQEYEKKTGSVLPLAGLELIQGKSKPVESAPLEIVESDISPKDAESFLALSGAKEEVPSIDDVKEDGSDEAIQQPVDVGIYNQYAGVNSLQLVCEPTIKQPQARRLSKENGNSIAFEKALGQNKEGQTVYTSTTDDLTALAGGWYSDNVLTPLNYPTDCDAVEAYDNDIFITEILVTDDVIELYNPMEKNYDLRGTVIRYFSNDHLYTYEFTHGIMKPKEVIVVGLQHTVPGQKVPDFDFDYQPGNGLKAIADIDVGELYEGEFTIVQLWRPKKFEFDSGGPEYKLLDHIAIKQEEGGMLFDTEGSLDAPYRYLDQLEGHDVALSDRSPYLDSIDEYSEKNPAFFGKETEFLGPKDVVRQETNAFGFIPLEESTYEPIDKNAVVANPEIGYITHFDNPEISKKDAENLVLSNKVVDFFSNLKQSYIKLIRTNAQPKIIDYTITAEGLTKPRIVDISGLPRSEDFVRVEGTHNLGIVPKDIINPSTRKPKVDQKRQKPFELDLDRIFELYDNTYANAELGNDNMEDERKVIGHDNKVYATAILNGASLDAKLDKLLKTSIIEMFGTHSILGNKQIIENAPIDKAGMQPPSYTTTPQVKNLENKIGAHNFAIYITNLENKLVDDNYIFLRKLQDPDGSKTQEQADAAKAEADKLQESYNKIKDSDNPDKTADAVEKIVDDMKANVGNMEKANSKYENEKEEFELNEQDKKDLVKEEKERLDKLIEYYKSVTGLELKLAQAEAARAALNDNPKKFLKNKETELKEQYEKTKKEINKQKDEIGEQESYADQAKDRSKTPQFRAGAAEKLKQFVENKLNNAIANAESLKKLAEAVKELDFDKILKKTKDRIQDFEDTDAKAEEQVRLAKEGISTIKKLYKQNSQFITASVISDLKKDNNLKFFDSLLKRATGLNGQVADMGSKSKDSLTAVKAYEKEMDIIETDYRAIQGASKETDELYVKRLLMKIIETNDEVMKGFIYQANGHIHHVEIRDIENHFIENIAKHTHEAGSGRGQTFYSFVEDPMSALNSNARRANIPKLAAAATGGGGIPQSVLDEIEKKQKYILRRGNFYDKIGNQIGKVPMVDIDRINKLDEAIQQAMEQFGISEQEFAENGIRADLRPDGSIAYYRGDTRVDIDADGTMRVINLHDASKVQPYVDPNGNVIVNMGVLSDGTVVRRDGTTNNYAEVTSFEIGRFSGNNKRSFKDSRADYVNNLIDVSKAVQGREQFVLSNYGLKNEKGHYVNSNRQTVVFVGRVPMIFINGAAYTYNYQTGETTKLGETKEGLVLLDENGNIVKHDKADRKQYLLDFLEQYQKDIQNAANLALQNKNSNELTKVYKAAGQKIKDDFGLNPLLTPAEALRFIGLGNIVEDYDKTIFAVKTQIEKIKKKEEKVAGLIADAEKDFKRLKFLLEDQKRLEAQISYHEKELEWTKNEIKKKNTEILYAFITTNIGSITENYEYHNNKIIALNENLHQINFEIDRIRQKYGIDSIANFQKLKGTAQQKMSQLQTDINEVDKKLKNRDYQYGEKKALEEQKKNLQVALEQAQAELTNVFVQEKQFKEDIGVDFIGYTFLYLERNLDLNSLSSIYKGYLKDAKNPLPEDQKKLLLRLHHLCTGVENERRTAVFQEEEAKQEEKHSKLIEERESFFGWVSYWTGLKDWETQFTVAYLSADSSKLIKDGSDVMNYLLGLNNILITPPSRLSEKQRREMYEIWKKTLIKFDCFSGNELSLQCVDITFDDVSMTISMNHLLVEMFSTNAKMPLSLFEQLIQGYSNYDPDAIPREETSIYYLWESVRVNMRGPPGDKFQQMSAGTWTKEKEIAYLKNKAENYKYLFRYTDAIIELQKAAALGDRDSIEQIAAMNRGTFFSNLISPWNWGNILSGDFVWYKDLGAGGSFFGNVFLSLLDLSNPLKWPQLIDFTSDFWRRTGGFFSASDVTLEKWGPAAQELMDIFLLADIVTGGARIWAKIGIKLSDIRILQKLSETLRISQLLKGEKVVALERKVRFLNDVIDVAKPGSLKSTIKELQTTQDLLDAARSANKFNVAFDTRAGRALLRGDAAGRAAALNAQKAAKEFKKAFDAFDVKLLDGVNLRRLNDLPPELVSLLSKADDMRAASNVFDVIQQVAVIKKLRIAKIVSEGDALREEVTKYDDLIREGRATEAIEQAKNVVRAKQKLDDALAFNKAIKLSERGVTATKDIKMLERAKAYAEQSEAIKNRYFVLGVQEGKANEAQELIESYLKARGIDPGDAPLALLDDIVEADQRALSKIDNMLENSRNLWLPKKPVGKSSLVIDEAGNIFFKGDATPAERAAFEKASSLVDDEGEMIARSGGEPDSFAVSESIGGIQAELDPFAQLQHCSPPCDLALGQLKQSKQKLADTLDIISKDSLTGKPTYTFGIRDQSDFLMDFSRQAEPSELFAVRIEGGGLGAANSIPDVGHVAGNNYITAVSDTIDTINYQKASRGPSGSFIVLVDRSELDDLISKRQIIEDGMGNAFKSKTKRILKEETIDDVVEEGFRMGYTKLDVQHNMDIDEARLALEQAYKEAGAVAEAEKTGALGKAEQGIRSFDEIKTSCLPDNCLDVYRNFVPLETKPGTFGIVDEQAQAIRKTMDEMEQIVAKANAEGGPLPPRYRELTDQLTEQFETLNEMSKRAPRFEYNALDDAVPIYNVKYSRQKKLEWIEEGGVKTASVDLDNLGRQFETYPAEKSDEFIARLFDEPAKKLRQYEKDHPFVKIAIEKAETGDEAKILMNKEVTPEQYNEIMEIFRNEVRKVGETYPLNKKPRVLPDNVASEYDSLSGGVTASIGGDGRLITSVDEIADVDKANEQYLLLRKMLFGKDSAGAGLEGADMINLEKTIRIYADSFDPTALKQAKLFLENGFNKDEILKGYAREYGFSEVDIARMFSEDGEIPDYIINRYNNLVSKINDAYEGTSVGKKELLLTKTEKILTTPRSAKAEDLVEEARLAEQAKPAGGFDADVLKEYRIEKENIFDKIPTTSDLYEKNQFEIQADLVNKIGKLQEGEVVRGMGLTKEQIEYLLRNGEPVNLQTGVIFASTDPSVAAEFAFFGPEKDVKSVFEYGKDRFMVVVKYDTKGLKTKVIGGLDYSVVQVLENVDPGRIKQILVNGVEIPTLSTPVAGKTVPNFFSDAVREIKGPLTEMTLKRRVFISADRLPEFESRLAKGKMMGVSHFSNPPSYASLKDVENTFKYYKRDLGSSIDALDQMSSGHINFPKYAASFTKSQDFNKIPIPRPTAEQIKKGIYVVDIEIDVEMGKNGIARVKGSNAIGIDAEVRGLYKEPLNEYAKEKEVTIWGEFSGRIVNREKVKSPTISPTAKVIWNNTKLLAIT